MSGILGNYVSRNLKPEFHQRPLYSIDVHAMAAFQADSVKLAVGQRKETVWSIHRSGPAVHSWSERARPVAGQNPGGTSLAQP